MVKKTKTKSKKHKSSFDHFMDALDFHSKVVTANTEAISYQ